MKNNFWTLLFLQLSKIFQKKAEQPKKIIKDTKEEVVPEVILDFEEDILYVDVGKGLNVRINPGVNKDNKIDTLKYGEEVRVLKKEKNKWFKVRYRGNKEGWVASQFLTEENPKTSTSEIKRQMSEEGFPVFKVKHKNLASGNNTKIVRKIINQKFGHTEASNVALQCVEYAHYMVKIKKGVDIVWPSDRPRHGGRWGNIFKKNNKYKILKEPMIYSAMSFANPSFNKPYGHVAFVDEVFGDGSIKISEANWPSSGIYNERILSKQQWSQERWGAEFIDFT